MYVSSPWMCLIRLLTFLRDVQPSFFKALKEERVSRQFGTSHEKHPYIALINSYGDFLVGGDLEVLAPIKWNDGLDQYRLTPRQVCWLLASACTCVPACLSCYNGADD